MPKPSPSPMRGAKSDPFVALDSNSAPAADPALLDDVSARFPALDDFSLLHDSGGKFAFNPKSEATKKPPHDISQRVTNALADDAFAQPKSTARPASIQPKPIASAPASETKAKASTIATSMTVPTHEQQPAPQRPTMVSTGTMTSPSPSSPTLQHTSVADRPIFRFPQSSSNSRSSSQPRASDAAEQAAATLRADAAGSQLHGLLEHRSKSQILSGDATKSSRPSFESGHRSSYLSGLDNPVHRSRSANYKGRPSSVQTPSKPNLLRRLSRERGRTEDAPGESERLTLADTHDSDDGEEAVKIDSNVEYLKAMEEGDTSKRKEKRLSSGSRHIKRASMPSVSLSGTKSLLAGRFGEAFRRFETSNDGSGQRKPSRSPSSGARELTPIAGSEATDGRSDDGNSFEETEEVPPEVRRELERRRLSQEEKRVADAGAAYRQRLAEGGDNDTKRPGSNNKAASIQSKVKSLLDESGRASPSPTKTAEGYGRFTDRPPSPTPQTRQNAGDLPPRTSSRQIPSRPLANGMNSQHTHDTKPLPEMPPSKAPSNTTRQSQPSSVPPLSTTPRHSAPPSDRPFQRPSAPPKPQPKPQALRTGDRRPQSPLKPSPLAARKPLPTRNPYQQQTSAVRTDEDWQTNFSKRYPSLSGLEMVETEIEGDRGATTEGPRTSAGIGP